MACRLRKDGRSESGGDQEQPGLIGRWEFSRFPQQATTFDHLQQSCSPGNRTERGTACNISGPPDVYEIGSAMAGLRGVRSAASRLRSGSQKLVADFLPLP